MCEPAAQAAESGNGAVKTRLFALGAASVTAWGLKRHYADAGPDDLLWILSPTAWLVGVMTGARFTFQAGEGYLSREHLFLIEKSCAGVNFMIAAFGMLVYALFRRIGSIGTAAQVLSVSLLASYSAAVVVNAARIVVAMWLAAHPAVWSGFSAADVHRIEGIAVYFGGLVVLYWLVRWVDCRGLEPLSFCWTAVPLASYYAVTLALPLGNGAARSGGTFARHALVVLVVPPMLIGLACAATFVLWLSGRRRPRLIRINRDRLWISSASPPSYSRSLQYSQLPFNYRSRLAHPGARMRWVAGSRGDFLRLCESPLSSKPWSSCCWRRSFCPVPGWRLFNGTPPPRGWCGE